MHLSIHKKELLAIILLVFAVYANALFWGGFQFDDFNVIVQEPKVHSWQAWRENLGQGIRPLLKLTYTVDWLSGGSAFGYHVTNLVIHTMNAMLAWLLTLRFVSHFSLLQPHAYVIGLATAMLFAVHPVHTEAVSYISGRSSSLMAFFIFCALLAYFAGRHATLNPDVPLRLRMSSLLLHAAVPACFLAAVVVKETAVVFPVALLVLERALGASSKTNFKLILKLQWPVWLVFFMIVAGFLVHQRYLMLMGHSFSLNDGLYALASQTHGFFYLVRQWFWPSHLNIDPDLPVSSPLGGTAMLEAFLLFLLAAWGVFRFFSAKPMERPWLWFALVWAILHLVALYLLFPRLDVVNERQLYVASWPLLVAIAAEMALILDEWKFALLLVMAILVGGVLTIMRNQDYLSEISLWESTIQYSPNKSRVHNNLGYAYLMAGRHEEAHKHFALALQLDPENYRAHFNLERVK